MAKWLMTNVCLHFKSQQLTTSWISEPDLGLLNLRSILYLFVLKSDDLDSQINIHI